MFQLTNKTISLKELKLVIERLKLIAVILKTNKTIKIIQDNHNLNIEIRNEYPNCRKFYIQMNYSNTKKKINPFLNGEKLNNIIIEKEDLKLIVDTYRIFNRNTLYLYVDKETFEFLYISDYKYIDIALGTNNLTHITYDKFIVFEIIAFPMFMNTDMDNLNIELYRNSKNEKKTEYYLSCQFGDYSTSFFSLKKTKKFPPLHNVPKSTITSNICNVSDFKFTVNNENKSFFNELNELFKQLGIIQDESNARDIKRKHYSYSLKEDTFLNLLITSSNYYTFSFNNLIEYNVLKPENNTQPYPLLSKKGIYEHPKLLILKEVLSFLNKKDLYDDSKIIGIGFDMSFMNKEDFPKMRLIEFNDSKKIDTFYKYYHSDKKNIKYTKEFHFKANIKDTKTIINRYLSLTKKIVYKNKLFDDLSHIDIKNILLEIFEKKFRKNEIVSVNKESGDRGKYYIKIDNADDKRFNKPIRILNTFDITFESNIDKNTNFVKIDKEKANLQTFNFQINKRKTTDKKILSKLKYSNGYFRLSDSIEAISDNINILTSKYKLLHIEDEDIMRKIENYEYKNQRDLEKEIEKNIYITEYMQFYKFNIELSLAQLLKKSYILHPSNLIK